jgi:hypothetical protein
VLYIGSFVASLICYVVLFVFSLVSQRDTRKRILQAGILLPVILSGVALTDLIVQGHHLPTHYLFERFLELGFGLGFLLFVVSFFEETTRILPYVIFMILILFGLCLVFPIKVTLPSFRYARLSSQLFFQLESLSFMLMSFSSAYCWAYLLEKTNLSDKKQWLTKARLYLLFGFVVFLTSQFIGSIWSLRGWGDYFVWGKMTFMGIVIWFYLMFVVHVRYLKSYGDRFMALSGSLLFCIIIFYRLIWQP